VERLAEYWKAHGPRPGSPEYSNPVTSAAAGRNDPCLCGSGKKYKKCCGAGRDLVELLTAELTWPGPDLSNAELDALVHADWSDAAGPVQLAADLPAALLAESRLLHNALVFMGALEQAGPVKLTAKGYLNREFVLAMKDALKIDPIDLELAVEQGTVRREEDFRLLRNLRLLCEAAGMLASSGGKLGVADAWRARLDEGNRGSLYRHLFVTHFTAFDLTRLFRGAPLAALQRTISYTLFAIHHCLGDWREVGTLGGHLLLPSVRAELDLAEWSDPSHALQRVVLIPLLQFGLLEAEIDSSDLIPEMTRARKTALFDRFVAVRL
jgi:hypothetical protein